MYQVVHMIICDYTWNLPNFLRFKLFMPQNILKLHFNCKFLPHVLNHVKTSKLSELNLVTFDVQ